MLIAQQVSVTQWVGSVQMVMQCRGFQGLNPSTHLFLIFFLFSPMFCAVTKGLGSYGIQRAVR